MILIHEAALQVVAAVLGVIGLHVFFRAVEVKWPESYFSLDDVTAQRIATRLTGYLAFRAGPVFGVVFFVSALLARAGFSYLIAAILVPTLHIGITNGRTSFKLRRRRHEYGYWSLVVGHMATIVVVLSAAAAAAALAAWEVTHAFVPAPDELVGSFWTALLAGVAGAYLVGLSRREPADVAELVRRSRRNIPKPLWDDAQQFAQVNNADPLIVRSIMIVENLQRPPWMRRLERIKAVVAPYGTYGIMQLASDRPLDDRESVLGSIEGHLRGAFPNVDIDGVPQPESVIAAMRRHNRDPRFLEMATAVYWHFYEQRREGYGT